MLNMMNLLSLQNYNYIDTLEVDKLTASNKITDKIMWTG